MFGPKMFYFTESFGQKQILGLKTYLDTKNICLEKNLGLKHFESQEIMVKTIIVEKNLFPNCQLHKF